MEFVGTSTNNLTESEALEKAKEDSLKELTRDDVELARAIKASVNEGNAVHVSDKTPPCVTSKSPNVAVLMTPKHKPTKEDATTESFTKRVEKRAFKRSLMTSEVVDPDAPTGSPLFTATSLQAAHVFHSASDRTNQPSVANFVRHCHEEHPLANSQEGHEAASDFVATLRGESKKKRSKKQSKQRDWM